MLSLKESLYPDCFTRRLKLDSSCAFLHHGSSRLVFSSILTAICVVVAFLTFSSTALRCGIARFDDVVSSDEVLTLETPAIHQTQQVKNTPYQSLLIKPVFN